MIFRASVSATNVTQVNLAPFAKTGFCDPYLIRGIGFGAFLHRVWKPASAFCIGRGVERYASTNRPVKALPSHHRCNLVTVDLRTTSARSGMQHEQAMNDNSSHGVCEHRADKRVIASISCEVRAWLCSARAACRSGATCVPGIVTQIDLPGVFLEKFDEPDSLVIERSSLVRETKRLCSKSWPPTVTQRFHVP